MSLPRFFIDEPLTSTDEVLLPLGADELKHVLVRRCEPGEHIVLVSDGHAWEVEITAATNKQVWGRMICELAEQALPHLTLVQGISKGDRMTDSVRQAAELGCERIIPFMCERSIVRIKAGDEAAKGERWRKVGLAASKQSGRIVPPAVDDPCKLKALLDELAAYDRVIICWEEADPSPDGGSLSIGEALHGCTTDSRVAVVIGPEGGFSTAEVEALRTLGDAVCVVTLGELILRTETASTVACALAMYTLGGLGNNAR